VATDQDRLVTGCRLGGKQSEGPFQLLRVRGRERLKLDPDSMCPGPTYDGAVNEDRVSASGKNELEVHLHAGECRKGAVDTATFARKIQRLADRMTLVAVDERAGKGRVKSGVLPYNHKRPAPERV
jgi:hypothetical protein